MGSPVLYAILSLTGCAFVGWFTNVIGVKMIFRPYERVRIIGPIGWQGILARHAGRFAQGIADIIVQEFFTLRQLVKQVNPVAVAARVRPYLIAAIDAGVERFVRDLPPVIQRSGMVGGGVLGVVKEQLAEEIDRLTPDVHDLIVRRCEALVDLRALIVENLTGGSLFRLESLIMEANAREFRWIGYNGALCGATFALLQLGLTYAGFSVLWILPAVGAVVGLVTHWLAIVMLFAPRRPVKVGPLALQGIFPRRQREIALAWAGAVKREMDVGLIIDRMLARGFGLELRQFVVERLSEFIETRLQVHMSVVAAADVEVKPEDMVDAALDHLVAEGPAVIAAVKSAIEDQIDVLALVQVGLEDMDKRRFEQVLRGLVKQDEKYLVAYGGLLGGVIGMLQVGLVRWL